MMATPSSSAKRKHTSARYGSRRQEKVNDNDGSSPSSEDVHANDSTSGRVVFMHPDELINGDLDLTNPVFANHVKSLMSPAEVARPDFKVLMEEKVNFIRAMRSDVRDFARTKIQSIMVAQASRSGMKLLSSTKNGPILDVVSFELLRKSWMRDSSFENRECIFQVTYGWFDHHPRWNIEMENDYMRMRNLVYRNSSPGTDDAANYQRRKKNCIAKHIADIKNNIVKGIRKAGMRGHGVSITITRPGFSITRENKYKKREKGSEYHVFQNADNNQHRLTNSSSLPDDDDNDDSDYDDDANDLSGSDESLIESLESIQRSTASSEDDDCWDTDGGSISDGGGGSIRQEMVGDDRDIAGAGGSGNEDNIDAAGDDNHAGNNNTDGKGGCDGNTGGGNSCGNGGLKIDGDTGRGTDSGDGSIAGDKEMLHLEQEESTKDGPLVHHAMPKVQVPCWCPHDKSLNHFSTVLGLESEDQAAYCGKSKKSGQGYYLHGEKCASCSAKFVVRVTRKDGNEFRPTRRKPAWACKWMTKAKVMKKCTFALCNGCFIVLSQCDGETTGGQPL
jgi:hypothetical protein